MLLTERKDMKCSNCTNNATKDFFGDPTCDSCYDFLEMHSVIFDKDGKLIHQPPKETDLKPYNPNTPNSIT